MTFLDSEIRKRKLSSQEIKKLFKKCEKNLQHLINIILI